MDARAHAKKTVQCRITDYTDHTDGPARFGLCGSRADSSSASSGLRRWHFCDNLQHDD
jgi:hypothetical protein